MDGLFGTNKLKGIRDLVHFLSKENQRQHQRFSVSGAVLLPYLQGGVGYQCPPSHWQLQFTL